MSSILFRHGAIHSPADPFAEALLVENGVISWLGADDSAAGFVSRADHVVDLNGLLVTPGFVDAHVHLLATGLTLEGIDLTGAAGIHSAADLLAAVAARTAGLTSDAPGEQTIIYGHGWDETAWDNPALPEQAALDRTSNGLPVLLTRADNQGSLVSSALAKRLNLSELAGWNDSGPISTAAHERAVSALTDVDSERHTVLTDSALLHAAKSGVVAVHEMAGTGRESKTGLSRLIARTADATSALPQVLGYWGELCETDAAAQQLKSSIPGLTGIGGDLCVDGLFSEHTAALKAPYTDLDSDSEVGKLLLTATQIATHIVAATRAGVSAALHVSGDAAMEEVIAGFVQAAHEVTLGQLYSVGHRLEHSEFVSAAALTELAQFGVGLSMQPAFDDEWGGAGGLYETRVGTDRAKQMHAWADITGAGIPLAFGSATPTTPIDPWRAVRSVLFAHCAEQRITARAAFRAHTRGGWRLTRLDHTGAGEIRVGAPAHLAFWDAPERAVQGPDRMFSAWNADARAGIPLLPALGPNQSTPRCVRTMRAGVVIYDELG